MNTTQLKRMSTEELLTYCAELRFNGVGILMNRTIAEFGTFVKRAFISGTEESAFINKYLHLLTNEHEHARKVRVYAYIFAKWCEKQ